MPKAKTEAQAADQIRRFKEAARALGCNEDEAAFDETLKKLGAAKPKPPPGDDVGGADDNQQAKD